MLEKIQSPYDLKQLSTKQKYSLADEIRAKVIDTVSTNGGHLASNLGNVELTLAIHSVFNSPEDKIIYDVGHQSYTHKLLTGRYAAFDTLRKMDGISGFTRREESEYDTVCSGHASSSISLALGFARARDISHASYSVVAILGDGALTGGMCYEALNDAGQNHTPLVIILNDNDMSISKNVGALSRHLTHMRQSGFYRNLKQKIRGAIASLPSGGKRLQGVVSRVKDSIKSLLVNDMFFDSLDIEYLGPVNGHDIAEIERTLQSAKSYDKPVLVHIITRKGKGYAPAEENPNKYHGVAPFDKETGKPIKPKVKTVGEYVGEWLSDKADTDRNIACVSAAMLSGTGMEEFERRHTDRCFDVGIAEEHAAAVAAGMALSGVKTYLALYSTFLQRAYDQICIDIGLNKANVTLLVDRCGLNGADGETHQGVFDASLLSQIPGMTVAVPADMGDLYAMLALSLQANGPMAIRYPRSLEDCEKKKSFFIGEWEQLFAEGNVCIIASGRMVAEAKKCRQLLGERSVSCAVINARFLKPLDEKMLEEALSRYETVFTLEDNVKCGGLGESVAAFAKGKEAYVHILCVPDRFIPAGTVEEQMRMCGLDAQSAADTIMNILESRG